MQLYYLLVLFLIFLFIGLYCKKYSFIFIGIFFLYALYIYISYNTLLTKPEYSYAIIDKNNTRNINVDDTILNKNDKVYNPNFVLYKNKKYTIVRCSTGKGKHSYSIILVSDSNDTIVNKYIIDPKTRSSISNYRINNKYPTGMEDLRLFVFNNILYAIGVNYDANNDIPRLIIMNINDYIYNNKETIIPLIYEPIQHLPNKNWAPLVYNDTLYLIAHFDPLMILIPNLETGMCTLYYQANQSKYKFFNKIRNSTIAIPLSKHKYLLFLHLLYNKTDKLYYQHRIGIIDFSTFETIISEPFNVEQSGYPHIEYISGCMYNKETFLIGYGLHDKQAKYFHLNKNIINSYFGYNVI
jgi:hypothetical protein